MCRQFDSGPRHRSLLLCFLSFGVVEKRDPARDCDRPVIPPPRVSVESWLHRGRADPLSTALTREPRGSSRRLLARGATTAGAARLMRSDIGDSALAST